MKVLVKLFAFPNKNVVESTSESTEETKETESEVSGLTTSSSSFDEKSSEEVVPAVEGQPPCRFKNRQTSCKHASVKDEYYCKHHLQFSGDEPVSGFRAPETMGLSRNDEIF